MVETMQDASEQLKLIAHRIEHHAKFGNLPPVLSSIVQRVLPARNRFPTDHLPEGSH